MRTAAILVSVIATAGCATAVSREQKPIAAIEVSTATQADKADLVSILKRLAPRFGFHVDDVSDRWREFGKQTKGVPPPAMKTLYVGVWNGKDDKDFIASVDDGGHNGRAWITCYSGTRPEAGRQFWMSLRSMIHRRWPNARNIPILPSGALPLAEDLRLTPDGYKVVRSAAARYDLRQKSSLLTSR